ncbi:transketolase [Williamsoniiplasma luminosum]|uniref:Transketolase n=1 Tax=Williamsoniiplasma luminosum TaxID=214888 RepID=A0A2K8NWX7_9MOLU|nr:transketolase [Williamsoniiplasma luminosum]ATZ17133.1 transketolase [Williamsoniiplasma luminosum]
MKEIKKIKEKSLTNLRILGIEQIANVNLGHPGIVMSAAPLIHEIYLNYIQSDVDNPQWINRDRFVLSAGHGSALLYSMLHIAGFDIKVSELKNFRTLNSITPGHPELGVTPGVDVSTGPLGQGFAMGVGLALAEKHLAAKYNQQDLNLINHKTFVLCGDGDLQEGVAQEAIQLAGVWKLNKLVVLYDSNSVQLDTEVKLVQQTKTKEWIESLNWNYIKVENGFDLDAVNAAIEKANHFDKPTLIECKTIIGYGHEKQGTPAMHGNPFSKDDLTKLRDKFNWHEPDFSVNPDVKELWSNHFIKRGKEAYKNWLLLEEQYKAKHPELWKELFVEKEIKVEAFEDLLHDKKEATRLSSSKALKRLQELTNNMIGGSADLVAATKVEGNNGTFSDQNPKGNNMLFGVREFAMGAISNGVQIHGGLRSFNSTFLVFSDYQKNSVRMAALQEIPTMFIYTHDSIAAGFDGPTHQPVEQLAGFRATPNLYNFRPADMKETIGAYVKAHKIKNSPSTLIFCRQDINQLEGTCWNRTKLGGYVILENKQKLDVIILATGSEVELAVESANKLIEKGFGVRVVSMPCIELFDEQPEAYKESIIPSDFENIVAIEAGASSMWYKYVGKKGLLFTVGKFGKSGDGGLLLKENGFEVNNIFQKIEKHINKK